MAIIKWSAINQIERSYGALCVLQDEWPYGARCVLRDEWPYGALCVQRNEWPYKARWNMEAIMHDFSNPKIRPFVKRSKCLVNNLSTLWKKSECLVKIRMPYEKSECLGENSNALAYEKSECLRESECLVKNPSALWKNPSVLENPSALKNLNALWKNLNALEKIRIACVKSKW